MLLSFSVFKDKIESGDKKNTIREYNEKRYGMFQRAKAYQLYWHNPRNGGKLIKERPPSGDPIIVFFDRSDGHIFLWGRNVIEQEKLYNYCCDVNTLAQWEGFKDFKEMCEWFYKHYGESLFGKLFMVLRWLP